MSGYIYKVTNLVNNKIYIGQTTQTFNVRKSGHISKAINKKSNSAFHAAIRKYGIEQFEWSIIWTGDSELLDEMEIYYIQKYNSFINNKKGYNMTLGGGGNRGFVMSDEQKEKIRQTKKSQSLKGKKSKRYNNTTYSFMNIITGVVENNITAYDLRTKYNLHHSNLSALIKGDRVKSYKGWKLIK